MNPNPAQQPVVIYGGNGFVGSNIARRIADRGGHCICVSRTGAMPVHLQRQAPDWLHHVTWLQGDAAEPDPAILQQAGAVVSTVGSPPLPTFSEAAFKRQVVANGTANVVLIEAANKAGVKRLVLVNAHIPALLQRRGFGYYVGKQQALDAARQFAESSPGHSSAVLTPSAIYGTRHSTAGTAIPLGLFMAPIAALQSAVPAPLARFLPEPWVSVDKVAAAAAELATARDIDHGAFKLVTNRQLLDR